MYDDVVHFEGLGLEWLLLPVLGVVLAKDHRDLAELGAVDAVGRRGDVPVVEQHPATLGKSWKMSGGTRKSIV